MDNGEAIMRRVKASPLRIRVPVARKATQVMRARKGRGSYRRDKQVSIDLKYRYLVIRDDGEELPSHNLFFGVKVFFNSLLDSSD